MGDNYEACTFNFCITLEIAQDKTLTFIPQRFKKGKRDNDFSWVW